MLQSPYSLYKLMILYLLRNASFPLTNTQITDLFLEKSYTSYFHLQEVLSDLVEQGLLQTGTKEQMTLYYLTPRGEETISYFYKDISPELRQELTLYLKEHAQELRRKLETTADYSRAADGEYLVRCQASEGERILLDLQILAPTENAAQRLADNWKKKSQAVYAAILKELG